MAAAISLAAQTAGWLQIPSGLDWVGPFLVVVVFSLAMLILLAGFSLRRVSRPIDSLLEATERLSAGDYAVRLDDNGPHEMRSVAQAFNQMASRLQSLESRRRNLLADVTHELRTPLTIIQGNLEGMLDGVYAPDEATLRALLDETQLLARLIDDLRTLALAESGALQLKIEPVEPAVLMEDSIAAFRSQASTARVDFVIQANPTLPTVLVDPQRIQQVLANLISNALRYAPPGSTITLQAADAGREPVITFQVHDQGAGIPPQDLEQVFERFYKSQDSGGSGLGLAIARRLVEAHNGKLWVESWPGAGSTFYFTLPL